MEVWPRCLRSALRQASSTIGRNHQASVAPYSTLAKALPSPTGQALFQLRPYDFAMKRIPAPFHQCRQQSGIFSSRYLLAESSTDVVPISSPLMPDLGSGRKTEKKGVASKPLKVQAIKKDIRQSPKKLNLVAKLVRGMRVEDALLQLQVTIKRAAKTVYQVIHSARANAAHNHGLDPERLLVDEAFVGKGLYLKRLSYHAKGRSGIMVRPRCRLTVVVRETTPEEEVKIAKLRVSNFKKLTRKERQLVPHQLIETTPRWGRKHKEDTTAA
ncbi:putative ribosomal protein L22/L17 [Dioscorea sansibarensis]